MINMCAVIIILMCILPPLFAQSTFEERQAAYFADQGRSWEAEGFAGNKIMRPLWAWLEGEKRNLPAYSHQGKTRKQLISDAINYITGEGWWGGALPGANPVVRLWFQYRSLLSSADQDKLKFRMDELGRQVLNQTNSVWCSVANWQFPNLVACYLYNSSIANVGNIVYPRPDPHYNCPPAFAYNGRTYVGGRTYNAGVILRDYLEFMMLDWIQNGTEEDLSTADYYQYQIHAIALLVDFAPDLTVREKAVMLLDWLILQHVAGFSAGHIAGGHGRSYTNYEFDGRDSFPFAIFFDAPDHVMRSFAGREMFASSYRVPSWLNALYERMNKTGGNDFYRIVRGRVPAFGNIADKPHGYRYDYVTPNYNLGGTGQGTGWELNIKTGGVPIKLFFCENQQTSPNLQKDGRACNAPCFFSHDGINCRMWYLFEMGQRGYQHRNALVSYWTPYLHEVLSGNLWDEETSEGGWLFKRKGVVALAIGLQPEISALEICTIGADYPDYAAFKTAVRANAKTGSRTFRTSKGVDIRQDYIDGTLPFERLNIREGHVGKNDEREILSFRNDRLVVEGRVLDFSRWQQAKINLPPNPPKNLTLLR